MENQIEKSIEQIALEDYAWKKGTEKLFKNHTKIAWISGSIAYILSVILYAYDSLIWNDGSVGLIISLFLCLFPAGFVVAMATSFHFFFSSLYRGKRKRMKMIASLPEEEKKKAIKSYLVDTIKDLKDRISYDKRKGCFAKQVIDEDTTKKALLEKMITTDVDDRDSIEDGIAELEKEISFFKDEYKPFEDRILKNTLEKEKLESELKRFS